jgi:hypothetical protein
MNHQTIRRRMPARNFRPRRFSRSITDPDGDAAVRIDATGPSGSLRIATCSGEVVTLT